MPMSVDGFIAGLNVAPGSGLGPGYYEDRISTERKIRSHVRQLEALGLAVTITPPKTPPSQAPQAP